MTFVQKMCCLHLRKYRDCSLLVLMLGIPLSAQEDLDTAAEDIRVIRAIFEEALQSGETYQLLEHLCLQIGHRLSGSEGAEKAVQWAKTVMEDFGFDNVYLQEVMVPHWVRGEREEAAIVGSGSGEPLKLSMLAIGGSVSTPEAGLTAGVVEVQSLEEVDELGEEHLKDKIVFFNRPFDQRMIYTGGGYGGAVDQRVSGASRAAKYGAVAVVIRSVTSAFDDLPHTGMLRYAEEVDSIPAAALGVQSAQRLSELLKKDPSVRLYLKLNCRWLPEVVSHNVVGEILGQEKQEEIIVIGGHLDSWDVGQGAHDDGAGCMQAIGVLRTFQKLGIKPKRTLRAVMFMNEENGSRGAKRYAEIAAEKGENHLIAIESDAGGFSPRGFGVTASPLVIEKMRSWLPLFDEHTICFIKKGGGGVDIRPLHETADVPMVGLITDSQRMFDVHHSARDVFPTVNRRELELGTGSLAFLVYLLDRYGL